MMPCGAEMWVVPDITTWETTPMQRIGYHGYWWPKHQRCSKTDLQHDIQWLVDACIQRCKLHFSNFHPCNVTIILVLQVSSCIRKIPRVVRASHSFFLLYFLHLQQPSWWKDHRRNCRKSGSHHFVLRWELYKWMGRWERTPWQL